MTKCKSCGANIVWIAMQSGKSMPCNAEQVVYWKSEKGEATIITPNGETVRATLKTQRTLPTGVGYISHFATCPNANTHRKRGNENGRKQN